MTDNEFALAMIGVGAAFVGTGRNQTRLRYIVADAFTDRAKELRSEGRPDRAGVCVHIATALRTGGYPSKRVAGKAKVDIAIVQDRIVDGQSVAHPA